MEEPTTESKTLRVHFNKDDGAIFALTFKTGFLTVLTLGIYRFWQKTRIRRHLWSSASVDGDAFEYTGTGLEKLLGFLIAIVFLAVYLGIVQMVLFFFGLSVLEQPNPYDPASQLRFIGAVYLSIFAVLPFMFYAVYSARRYKMARTRWRGIRFGMDKGAWGFVWRVIAYGLLSMITLGILTPLGTFRLEKYMTDRSHFGSARFEQGGKWTALYAAMKHIFIAVGLFVGGGILMAIGAMADMSLLATIAGIVIFVAYFWLLIGGVYYAVRSFAYLTDNKRLGDEIGFRASPSTGEVIKTYLIGLLAVGVAAGIILAIAFGIGALLIGGMAGLMNPASMSGGIGAGLFAFLLILGLYGTAFGLISALSMMLITQPILAHFITSIYITNAQAIDDIEQRESDTGVDAEGFADALDVGGAI